MKKIQILGSGCPKCKKLAQHVEEALQRLQMTAHFEVEKVTDMETILNMGVMMTPALVIDREVKSVGKVLSVDEICRLSANYSGQSTRAQCNQE